MGIVVEARDERSPEPSQGLSWKILLVDDDEAVHAVTRLALSFFEFNGRPIEILQAYTGAEGLKMFEEHSDIAAALIDVVMESDDAGLKLVQKVREQLDNHDTQLIIRTGQPGFAPEEDVILEYEINDYHNKTDLSHTRLKTTIVTALRNWDNIQRVQESELARIQAESLALSKSMFLAQMSHEIRTPMNGVLGIAELLSLTDLDDEQREYLDTIYGSAHALLTVLNDILDFSKIEAGKLELEEILFRPATILDELKRLFRAQVETQNIKLRVHVDKSIPDELLGDPIRLRQILTNLVGNAIKFTAKGSIDIHVKTKRRIDEDVELSFHVKDTGQGIPEDILPSLFTEYRQASSETARKHGGTGLGLAICKRLTELMGGTIDATSKPGEGSDFHFTACFKLSDHDSQRAVKRQPTLVSNSGHKLRLLIAEDNSVNEMIVRGMLKNLGLEATYAKNGRLALELVQKQDFDMILMDCRMPEMDGLEATREILKLKGKSCPPIIAMTAAVTQEEKKECFEVGMCDVLPKPMVLADLQQILQRWRN